MVRETSQYLRIRFVRPLCFKNTQLEAPTFYRLHPSCASRNAQHQHKILSIYIEDCHLSHNLSGSYFSLQLKKFSICDTQAKAALRTAYVLRRPRLSVPCLRLPLSSMRLAFLSWWPTNPQAIWIPNCDAKSGARISCKCSSGICTRRVTNWWRIFENEMSSVSGKM